MRALLEAEYVQVLAQDSKTTGLMVHEGDERRATRQRLDPERSRAREEVEHVRSLDPRSDEVEDRLLDHALRGPDPFRRLEPASPRLPAADSQSGHGIRP